MAILSSSAKLETLFDYFFFFFFILSLYPFRFPSISSFVASSISFGLKEQRVIMASKSASSLSGSTETIVGETLGDVRIFTAAGEPVFFKDLWNQKEGLAVVALLRHFGCPFCWEFASALKESKPRFDSAGVKLIAVGVGEPNKACILAERLPFPMDCLYADPDRKAYDVLGLHYGFGRMFFNPVNAKVMSRFGALREAVRNYTIGATPDDKSSILQQGGVFVFKGKELLYSRKDEVTADHASLEDILEICCAVPVA